MWPQAGTSISSGAESHKSLQSIRCSWTPVLAGRAGKLEKRSFCRKASSLCSGTPQNAGKKMLTHSCTCTLIHARSLTYTQTHSRNTHALLTHTHMHSASHTSSPKYPHETHSHVHIYADTLVHMHVLSVHTHPHTHTHAHTHILRLTHLLTCTHICVLTHTRLCFYHHLGAGVCSQAAAPMWGGGGRGWLRERWTHTKW